MLRQSIYRHSYARFLFIFLIFAAHFISFGCMEIEVKILEINRQAIEQKLHEMAAIKSFEAEFLAVFFDTQAGDILQKQCALRLRKEGAQTVLTFKEPMGNTEMKIMKETEVMINDAEAMRTILRAIGLKEIGITRKMRTEYKWNNTKIVLDQYLDNYNFIPLFMEVEAENESEVALAVETLGYQLSDCKNWNTYELVKYYTPAT